MQLKTITIVTLIVAGLVVIMMLGREGQNNQASAIKVAGASHLSIEETIYDFGDIKMADGNVEKIFTFKNQTTEDIKLSKLETSCMCTSAFIENGGQLRGPFGMEGMQNNNTQEVIKAGASFNVKVVYDPNAHGPAGVGTIDRFIELTEENGAVTELEIKALVTP